MKKYILLFTLFLASCTQEKTIGYPDFFNEIEKVMTAGFTGEVAQNNRRMAEGNQVFDFWLKKTERQMITIRVTVAPSPEHAMQVLERNRSKITGDAIVFEELDGGEIWGNDRSHNIIARDKNVYFKISAGTQRTAQPIINRMIELLKKYDVQF